MAIPVTTFGGTYTRKLLPQGSGMRLRRVLCLTCGATHAVMPAALLGRIRYPAETLGPYLESANPTEAWQQAQSCGPQELSTLYRWLRRLRVQLTKLLPLLQQSLLELVPETTAEPYHDPILTCNPYQHALWLAKQLLQASETLLQQTPRLSPVAFLNYFCWLKTGRPLLSPLSKPPP